MSRIRDLMESGDKEGCLRWIDDRYEEDPASVEASYYFAHLMLESDHPGPARFILEEISKRHPDKWQALLHLGKCYEEAEEFDKAEESWLKGLEMQPDNQGFVVGLSNIYTQQHMWDKAKERCLEALSMGPSLQAEVNLSFISLASKDFGLGWDLYAKGVGHMRWRDHHDYGLPNWNGEDGKVIVYGEQGLGDQIAFCSALPEMIEQGMVAAINTTPKLVKLFQESFGVPVFPDQFAKDVPWAKSLDADYQAPMSHLMKHLRRDEESFPGTPFLKVSEDRIYQWQTLLNKKCKGLKVGICWTGGKKKSHSWKRKGMPLDDLKDILQVDGVDWICMEYKDRTTDLARIRKQDGLLIRDWPWGTRTSDYSDTAAMVQALDLLITVPTSVNHLAGALGKEVHCLVHDRPHFHYASGMPYYSSVHLHKRGDRGVEEIKALLEERVSKKNAA